MQSYDSEATGLHSSGLNAPGCSSAEELSCGAGGEG